MLVMSGLRGVRMSKYLDEFYKENYFYVYTLVDPRSNSIFYVGKGKKDRINQHERQALTDYQSHKCNKIRAIWNDGHKVKKEFVKWFAKEQDAYLFESRLIRKLGLDLLTNVVCSTSDFNGLYPATKPKVRATYVPLDVEGAKKIFYHWPDVTKDWLASGRLKASKETKQSLTAWGRAIHGCCVVFINSILPQAYDVLIADEQAKQEMKERLGYV